MDLRTAIDPDHRYYIQSRWRRLERPLPRTIKEWEAALHKIRGGFEYAERQMVLDFEGYAIKRYTNAAMFPMHKTWHWALTWHIQRYRIVRAAAQAAFPSHAWAAL